MAQGQHDFDHLRASASLPDDVLEKMIDADSIAVMQRVVVLLGGGTHRTGLPLDRADFVAMVRAMDRLYREGALLLGEAIVEASEWGVKHDAARARAVYERFLAGCRSKFHREIARYRLRKLGAAAMAAHQANDAIAVLAHVGVDPAQQRPFDFYLHFPTEGAAAAVGHELSESGFRCQARPGRRGRLALPRGGPVGARRFRSAACPAPVG